MDYGVFLAVGAVLLGCLMQRTSGMGVGLIVSPVLVLLLGPVAGVLLANVTAVVSAALMTIAVRSNIDWKRYAQTAPVVIIGSIPAVLLIGSVDAGWLEMIIGIVLLIAVGGTTLLPSLPQMPLIPAGITAGIFGGFLNTAVGVASPAYLIYAQVTSWEHKPFAATLQPLFFTMGVVSIIVKTAFGLSSSIVMPPWPLLIGVAVAVPIGVFLAGKLAPKVPVTAAHRLAVAVVIVGAAATLVRGLLQVLPG